MRNQVFQVVLLILVVVSADYAANGVSHALTCPVGNNYAYCEENKGNAITDIIWQYRGVGRG